MAKRLVKKPSNETNIEKTAKVPTPKKVVPAKSGKTGAIKTAPKKVKTSEVADTTEKTIEPVKKLVVKKKVVKREAPMRAQRNSTSEAVEPVKRTPIKKVSKTVETKPIPVADRIGPAKTKRLSEDKYIRIPHDADIEKYKEMSSRIQSGSIQWAYFACDGDKGYHYYLVLK